MQRYLIFFFSFHFCTAAGMVSDLTSVDCTASFSCFCIFALIFVSTICATFTGYYYDQGFTARSKPLASTLSPTFPLSILLSCYPSTPLPDNSVHLRTHALSVFLSSKLNYLVKEHCPLQVQLNGTYCRTETDTPNLVLHLKQL